MAKQTKQTKQAGGPYLAAAFFCEKVIEDKQDSALSAIRIIDQVKIVLPSETDPDFPSDQDKVPVTVLAVLAFKTGDAAGHHAIRAELVSPSGKKNQPFERTMPFSVEAHGGANLRLNLTIMVVKGGLFWLDVYLDGKRVTRMPIDISVTREPPLQNQLAEPTAATQA